MLLISRGLAAQLKLVVVQETKVAELLFLPAKTKKKIGSPKKTGSRVSRRLLKQQREKEAALELEGTPHRTSLRSSGTNGCSLKRQLSTLESGRRKKQLKTAQKFIMLWNPDGAARKPPREAAELLLSVEGMFGLAELFLVSVDPDFLLLTLGGTNRAAVERAYDWLIPIISKLPAMIGRLPSSASCFLLLRAYGADRDERTQLRQLSAPLLSHVTECLNGTYGQSDCVKAFDLIMSDMASHKAERRRCARRVLFEALRAEHQTPSKLWPLRILELQYADALVGNAVKHMVRTVVIQTNRFDGRSSLAIAVYSRHIRAWPNVAYYHNGVGAAHLVC